MTVDTGIFLQKVDKLLVRLKWERVFADDVKKSKVNIKTIGWFSI